MPNSPQSRTTGMPPRHSAASKTPIVTASFWILKVLTTGLGEAASGALVRAFGGVAVAATAGPP
jgi:uncharacterized membrane-anchored protein